MGTAENSNQLNSDLPSLLRLEFVNIVNGQDGTSALDIPTVHDQRLQRIDDALRLVSDHHDCLPDFVSVKSKVSANHTQ
jgi:hypothetical protein